MLKPSYQNFCDHFVKTGNATESYMIAYPNTSSKKVASSLAQRLLKKEEIKTYLQEQMDKAATASIWDARDIIRDLKAIAENELNTKTTRLRAYQLGMTCLGMNRQEIKHSGQIDSTLSHLTEEQLDAILKKDDDDDT